MQVATEEHAATTPIRELKENNLELVEKNDSMMETIQSYGNEILDLKR